MNKDAMKLDMKHSYINLNSAMFRNAKSLIHLRQESINSCSSIFVNKKFVFDLIRSFGLRQLLKSGLLGRFHKRICEFVIFETLQFPLFLFVKLFLLIRTHLLQPLIQKQFLSCFRPQRIY